MCSTSGNGPSVTISMVWSSITFIATKGTKMPLKSGEDCSRSKVHFTSAAVRVLPECNAIHKSKGLEELDPLKFDRLLRQRVKVVGIDPALTKRSVNDGFSGGEKKRNEVLQMAVLEPTLAILDEPDSGLDVDALRTVAQGINQLRSPEKAILLVTHYQRILNYVIPDFVHVLVDGRIVKSGGKELALEIEAEGYEKFEQPQEEAIQSPG